MSRYVSFHDFDWLLLIFVLIICGLGVMEIRSATMHTKFVGSHIKQIYWVLGRRSHDVSDQRGELPGAAG